MKSESPDEPRRMFLPQWLRHVTVEPVMFLYMFAFMMTGVFEQAFFVDRACRANLNFNETICENFENQDIEIQTAVQMVVARFLLWNSFASYLVPILLALFLGAWSDKRGRKLPLIIGLIGKFFYSSMIVLIALQPQLPVESILYLASLPAALTGADIAIFSSSYSYLADITPTEKRTFRITILDAVYLSSMPIGVALGKLLFNTILKKSYALMFAVNASFVFLAIIYAVIRLAWTTKPSQETIWNAAKVSGSRCVCVWGLFDFLDWHHVKSSFKTILRKRSGKRRTYLLLFFLAIALYSFQRDERSISYLYTQLKFKWNANYFSDFRTFQNTALVLGTLSGYPFLSRLVGLRDEYIALIACSTHIIARLLFALAENPWMFYLGGGIVSFGSMVAPIIRSMVTKMVSSKERGKVLAVLSSCDAGIPIIASASYSQLYSKTINYFPQSIFLLTISTQLVLFCIILYIRCTLGKETIEVPEYELAIPNKEIED